MTEFIKRFGGPGELPNASGMKEWWRLKVLMGGPYVDRVPAVDEPPLSLLDMMEDAHGLARRPRRAKRG